MAVRRKCFVSYHQADKPVVDRFIQTFGANFIRRGMEMTDDIIGSNDTDYVMRRIRQLYLEDSTVTLVLIGQCTCARRYVDWEVQASLRQPADGFPNGLVAIQLAESFRSLPERVQANVDSGYAKFYKYPSSQSGFNGIVEEAFDARTTLARKIVNKRERFSNNRKCP
ncbi:MAG: TIR domain-containing protein [Gammaproteobacteria bacterium]|nr:TIR domain-containing protein [Gammaproteobacteria bacterium]